MQGRESAIEWMRVDRVCITFELFQFPNNCAATLPQFLFALDKGTEYTGN